ncbi:hypothetical protein OAZ15_04245 [Pelagibacteraceae bacterium]|nr:hypothetical protein [Pelagibacteraceae bacterium]
MNDKISVIEFEGCDYLGEVNEDMQPHGRGVLKSKDNFSTTNGWWKNGLLHGEATISKGYNKENEDEKLKEQRKGNYFEGDEHNTHSFTAFRDGRMREIIQEYNYGNLVYDTNENGKHRFYLSSPIDYAYLISDKISLHNVEKIYFENEKAIEKIDLINDNLKSLFNSELIFFDYSNWINYEKEIFSLFSVENFNIKCIPDIIMQEVEVKNREDVSKLNYFTKKFITHVYRSFALSKFNNFEDNFHEFSIGFQDTTDQSLVELFNFGHQSNWGYHELEEMKTLSAKDHEKLCEKGLENFSIHKWMVLDNVYDVIITIQK